MMSVIAQNAARYKKFTENRMTLLKCTLKSISAVETTEKAQINIMILLQKPLYKFM